MTLNVGMAFDSLLASNGSNFVNIMERKTIVRVLWANFLKTGASSSCRDRTIQL